MAGPKFSLVCLTLSIAAKNTALDGDFKHLCSNMMFYETILATTEFSSTISFGSNSIA
jgi:hypothetical protein